MQTKPVIPYTDVESEFIQEAIKNNAFDDRHARVYVNELVCIESFLKHGVNGFASGMKNMSLRKRFQEEYDIIQEELDPEGYADRKRRRAEIEQEAREEEAQHPEELAEARRDWEVVSEGDTLPFTDR